MFLLISFLLVALGAAGSAFFSRLAAHLLALEEDLVYVITLLGCLSSTFIGCINATEAYLLMDSTERLYSLKAFTLDGLILAVVTGIGCAAGISLCAVSIKTALRFGSWIDRVLRHRSAN